MDKNTFIEITPSPSSSSSSSSSTSSTSSSSSPSSPPPPSSSTTFICGYPLYAKLLRSHQLPMTLTSPRYDSHDVRSRLAQCWQLSRQQQQKHQRKATSDLATYKFKLFRVEVVDPESRLNPKARSGHRMIADDLGDLYSFGGFNIQVSDDDRELSCEPEWQKYRPLFQELWKFNWRTRRWKKLRTTGDIPDKLVSHCMCYWNEKIILYGGTGLPYGDNSSNKLTMYHIANNCWEVIEPKSDPARSPIEMYGQACVCDEQRGDIYVVGGTNGSQYSLDVHKFNLYDKKWTVLHKSAEFDDEPGCRYRHEMALYNNKLYLFGGSTNLRYYAFDRLPVFDLETRCWTFCQTKPFVKRTGECVYPEKRKCHNLAVIGNDCYICGGTNGEEVCSDIWHVNLEHLKWTLIVERIPYPVYFHAAATSLHGQLTIFGGVDNVAGDSRNNKLTSIWLKIPSLKIICLTAVSYYVKNSIIDPRDTKIAGFIEALEVSGDITAPC